MPDFTLHSIPREWSKLLSRIQQKESRALIAGGCLRDHYLERPVADIDIFVPDDETGAAGVIRYDRPVLAKSVPKPYFTHDSDVRQIGYYESAEERLTPVNLIHVSSYACTPWDQIERFDFGICQIAFDGQQLFMTSAFGRDVKERTFTYLRQEPSEAQHEASMGRFERLSLKYPGWKLRQPLTDALDVL